MRKTRKHQRDVAAASAALLFNLLPELSKLPASERYERLVQLLEGSLAAYDAVPEDFQLPIPSRN